MKHIKTFIAILLALSLVFSCAYISFAKDKIYYGDPNNDDHINLNDITLMLRYIAGWNLSEREFDFAAADVNLDGVVNLSDVTKLLQYIAGWGWMLGQA